MKANALTSFFFPIFLLCILAEAIYARWSGRGGYSLKDSGVNFLVAVGQYGCEILAGLVLLPLYGLIHSHRLFTFEPDAVSFVILVVLLDFVYYWVHRFSHESRWMWASHVVHHSSTYLNLTTSFRLSWTGFLSGVWLFWVPLVLIGFTPWQIVNAIAVNLIYQFFTHSIATRRLGWLEWVLNTPSHHRVHHAVNPQYLDKNYAGIFIVWDRLFGTFAPEAVDEPIRYGTVTLITTSNPFRIALDEWVALLRDVARAPTLRDKWMFAFGPPGWSADGSRQTSRQMLADWQRDQAQQVQSKNDSANHAAPAFQKRGTP